MALISALKCRGRNGFGYGTTAAQVTADLDLGGKTFLITGVNSGLGLETLRALSARGGTIIATARTLEKASSALGQTPGVALACELSEPTSVRACVQSVRALGRPLDAIICNAGVMALPKLETKYGYELQFLTNHLGHFTLVNGLLDLLSATGRVVMTSSEAHRMAPASGIDFDNLDGARGYQAWAAYGRAKLANILFARGLAKRFAGSSRTANAVHPGIIMTNLWRHMGPVSRGAMSLVGPLFFKKPAEGAATQTYVAAHPLAADQSGLYFADCNPKKPSAHALDDLLGERLWSLSEEFASRG